MIYNAYIGDLGFATAINKTLDSESRGVYGALPNDYVGNFFRICCISKYKSNDSTLAAEICFNGLRPTILKGTATCYTELLRRCWNADPEKRPTAIEIHETILNWKK
ncbi:hypothetical protein C2G38_2174067 [Gigaspora rosea]|uniref:Serine-threonine/tyrosine-protein kinase catalytic domain-containing protein n=1 Tax=Gigaspora rosea TaxID=44941 RepID=A0A397VKN4_9GLOM|nr:hypothetical protein C2G38_2174067 [Gigaspora rosea]